MDELRPHRARRHAGPPGPLRGPRRIFTVTVEATGAAGLVGEKRILDSTPVYDAVTTMDTITLIRSAMRWPLWLSGTPDGLHPARAKWWIIARITR